MGKKKKSGNMAKAAKLEKINRVTAAINLAAAAMLMAAALMALLRGS